MEDESRPASPAIVEDLAAHPEQFEFFQAIRLLLLHCARQRSAGDTLLPLIGSDVPPAQEPIQLALNPRWAFRPPR